MMLTGDDQECVVADIDKELKLVDVDEDMLKKFGLDKCTLGTQLRSAVD